MLFAPPVRYIPAGMRLAGIGNQIRISGKNSIVYLVPVTIANPPDNIYSIRLKI